MFCIAGLTLSRPPQNDEEFKVMAVHLSKEIAGILDNEQDIYWFVIEEYDRLMAHPEITGDILSQFPLFEMEYKGMRSEDSYVGKPNPGVEYLSLQAFPPLYLAFGYDGAIRSTAGIFIYFCQMYHIPINALRIKYATHYRNNTVSAGHFRVTDRWDEVLNKIPT